MNATSKSIVRNQGKTRKVVSKESLPLYDILIKNKIKKLIQILNVL